MYMHKFITMAGLLAGLASAAMAQDVDIRNAWVRTAVQGQSATGAFMTLTAKQDTRLIGVISPVAGVGEVHEMKMDGGVMKMRAVEGGLLLRAGKPVELKPGGYHLMLMDLKAALPKDSTVPVTLVFKDTQGAESRVDLTLPVAASAAASAHKH